MKTAIVGGGPAGLYFAILRKKAFPRDEIVVYERNAADQTFGWGVVFSDETLSYLEENDTETYARITESFVHWTAIDVVRRGERLRSGGHGFSGLARKTLLRILQERAAALGVRTVFRSEVGDVRELLASHDLVIGSDGVRSQARARFEEVFRPTFDVRACKYIWLGTHRKLDAFQFLFEENEHGVFQAHAYPFEAGTSTFIVECDETSFRAAGLHEMPVGEGVAYCERLFEKHLHGEKLLSNNAQWVSFPTVKCARWHHENLVLLGDAAHTAHFSIGSGTKLAMEDSIALVKALGEHERVTDALVAYEAERRPMVERFQKAAQDSLVFFENIKRYAEQGNVEFAFNLLTRSKRITYENLRLRDAPFVERVTEDYAARVGAPRTSLGTAPPPMFTPFELRGLRLENRVVVSPMCMYSAKDGTPNDFHLVHLGARAMGGAGLVFTEMTDVLEDGRITPGCAGLYTDEHTRAWKRIVDFVHEHSRAKICMQLGHAGRKGATCLLWEGMDEPLPEGGWPILSASPIPYFPHSQVPREMARADMDRVRDAFVAAARRADEAGFDMLEVHMAHGYLLASFLSPLTNHRTDAYGGAVENRLRFPLEVFDAVRAVFPSDKPMSARISACDWAEGGLSAEDCVAVAKALAARGCDIVDVSSGQTVADAKPVFGRMYQTPFSDLVRHGARVPTIAVGNISSADQVNTILAAGRADLCALARPHLDDPHFTLHAAKEQAYPDIYWPPQYLLGKPRLPSPAGAR